MLNTVMLFHLVGGIGLFLLGMMLLTDGLKSFAGDSLREVLLRLTGKPIRAFFSGVVVTSAVQSSSATTVAVIGFVSAGLLGFPQAVGMVIGASLGTTATSWLVSVVGLQFSVGFYALPLVGVGAFIKLLARGRWRSLGVALAGFGLIFIGIQTLQDGMSELADVVHLAELPAGGLGQNLLMLLVGIALTVVMQSSSAAMATTLTALHTGAIHFEHAAVLVIGAAIGTTVTGALAAIGASVPAKRTALAHVTFNLATGLVALVCLPLFLWGVREAQNHWGLQPGAVSLAAFHTAFIAIGVLLFFPFVGSFARCIERLLPEKDLVATRHLDDSVLAVPSVALEASRRALVETAVELFNSLRNLLQHPTDEMAPAWRQRIEMALNETQRFMAKIPEADDDQPISESRVAQMHAIDHLVRLLPSLTPPPSLLRSLRHDDHVRAEWNRTKALLARAAAGLHHGEPAEWLESVERSAYELAESRRRHRPFLLQQTAGGRRPPTQTLEALDAVRWLDRVAYHTWRICNYLGGEGTPEPAPDDQRIPALD